MSTFLILGGTGKVGRRVVRDLRAAGHTARVASRRADTSTADGAVRFDWLDATTHAPALAGADGVFVVGPGSATDWSPLLRAFLDTAHAAGVRHAVLLSARGVEFLPDGAVARAEQALRAGPLAWTILRPTHFAQNFTEAMFVPDEHGEVRAPVGDARHPFVDVEDIAAVAAAVLTAPDGAYDAATLALSGPEALTFAAAVAILGAHAGKTYTFVVEDRDEHVAHLRAAGTPEGYVTWRMAMLDGIARGDDTSISHGVALVLDRPATAFAAFAARASAA